MTTSRTSVPVPILSSLCKQYCFQRVLEPSSGQARSQRQSKASQRQTPPGQTCRAKLRVLFSTKPLVKRQATWETLGIENNFRVEESLTLRVLLAVLQPEELGAMECLRLCDGSRLGNGVV